LYPTVDKGKVHFSVIALGEVRTCVSIPVDRRSVDAAGNTRLCVYLLLQTQPSLLFPGSERGGQTAKKP
jgi:hypothetical protein